MKKLILVLSLLVSVSSFTCDTLEAQFIGEIERIDYDNIGNCYLKLNFTYYSEHFFCPLDQQMAEKEGIFFPKKVCESSKFSQKQSGIMVYDYNTDKITLDY